MKFKRWKGLIIALLILVLTGSAIPFLAREHSRSTRILSQLSDDERHCLSVFLDFTLFYDNFAYLLFGSKPIAITGCQKSTPSFYFSRHFLSSLDVEEKMGFEVFKKMQHLFCSRNVIVHITEDEDNLYLLMINKKNLLRTLQEHIEDFKQVLGAENTVESLFNRITAGKEHLADVLKKHQALLGILLGFGRNNSWLFHEKSTIRTKLKEFAPPKKRDSSLEKELDLMDQNTTAFSENSRESKYILRNPSAIPLPGFMVDPHSLETKQLKERYEKDRQGMKKIFAKQSFVDATLQLLMKE